MLIPFLACVLLAAFLTGVVLPNCHHRWVRDRYGVFSTLFFFGVAWWLPDWGGTLYFGFLASLSLLSLR